jgi:molybdopterin synthase catalytic subunit
MLPLPETVPASSAARASPMKDELTEAHKAGALMIFVNIARKSVQVKLSRYETSLLNNMSRIIRLLEAEEKMTKVVDV